MMCLLGLAVLVFCIDRARKGSDFEVYLAAAKAILVGQNMYEASNTLDVQYFYSPFFALVLAPFTYLPAFVVKLTWLLFSVYCMYRIWKLLRSYYPVTSLTDTQQKWWAFLSFGILAGFIIDNFHMVQITFFMLWATLESINLIWSGKTVKGALLLGLAINVKVMPLLFLPYLFYRNKWKSGLLCIAFIAGFTMLPYLFLEDGYHSYLLQEWWNSINPMSAAHTLELDRLTFDLPALVAAILTTETGELETSYEAFHAVLTGTRLFFIMLTLAFLRSWPFRGAPFPLHQGREIAYLLLVTVLLFPHQNKYANVYLLPAFAYIFFYLMAVYNQDRQVFRSVFRYQFVLLLLLLGILCLTMTGSSIAGETLYNWLSRYKSITIGTILIVPVMLLLSPALLLRRPVPEKVMVKA
jgi:hypothetical protein